MTNLVFTFEYLVLLCFLTAAEFCTLGNLKDIIRVPFLGKYNARLIFNKETGRFLSAFAQTTFIVTQI